MHDASAAAGVGIGGVGEGRNRALQVVSATFQGYIHGMGKSVQVDDDVMRAAERLAVERGTTPDAVISEAARASLVQPVATDARPPAGAVLQNGWYVLPHRGGPPVASELVARLLDDADLGDAVRVSLPARGYDDLPVKTFPSS
jgi:hypothetical protein